MELWEQYKEELDALLALRDKAIDASATISNYLAVFPGGADKDVVEAWSVVYEWLNGGDE